MTSLRAGTTRRRRRIIAPDRRAGAATQLRRYDHPKVSSNPPPSQLRTLIGGTCNASGNLTLKSIVPSRSFYSVFTAILKVTAGAPQWEIDLLGVPVGIGGGGVVVMGAIYANPGES